MVKHGLRRRAAKRPRLFPWPAGAAREMRLPGNRLMLYVFDCDGVLVDSEIISSKVDAEHLTRLGYPITAEEVTVRFAGLTARELGAIVEVELGHPLPPNFFER